PTSAATSAISRTPCMAGICARTGRNASADASVAAVAFAAGIGWLASPSGTTSTPDKDRTRLTDDVQLPDDTANRAVRASVRWQVCHIVHHLPGRIRRPT